MGDDRLLSAHDLGIRASQREKPRAVNPYLPIDQRYDAWLAGWIEEEGPVYLVPSRGA